MIKLHKVLYTILIIAIFFFTTILAFAQSIPPYIKYQGRLVDQTTGEPINEEKSITFFLYKTSMEVTPIYYQTKEVNIDNGIFSVYIGKGEGHYNGNIISDGIPVEVFTKDLSKYLGIKIADSQTEMSPRQLIASVAYAYIAEKAKEAETLMGQIIVCDSGNVGIGLTEPKAKLEVNGKIKAEAGFGYVPIGTILPWHKSMTGTPALPDGWVECNGLTINDAESLYNGQTIPDLNGEARFLRGNSTSGIYQDDAFQGHEHQRIVKITDTFGLSAHPATGETNAETKLSSPSLNIVTDGLHGTPRVATETRPINMSVVWIIRIK